MFDYTKVALRKTLDDFKSLQFGFNVTVQAAYIFYLIYAIVFGVGFLAVNIVLLALSVAYAVFFFITNLREKRDKKLGKRVKYIYKITKHSIKVFTLSMAIASICIDKEEVTPFAVMFVALMVVGFVLQVIIDIAVAIFSAKMDFLLEAIKADTEEIKKPFEDLRQKVTFWKKEEPQAIEKNKNRIALDALVEGIRAEKVAIKNKKKEEKREEKRSRRAAFKEKLYGNTIGRIKRAKKPDPPAEMPKIEEENKIPALAAPQDEDGK